MSKNKFRVTNKNNLLTLRLSNEKIKNGFEFNKLFLYFSLNSFYLFLSIITRLNNLKIYKF